MAVRSYPLPKVRGSDSGREEQPHLQGKAAAGRRKAERSYSMFKVSERVTGRKARDLQTEEIGCKSQTFFSLLGGKRKQTSDFFFFSIHI